MAVSYQEKKHIAKEFEELLEEESREGESKKGEKGILLELREGLEQALDTILSAREKLDFEDVARIITKSVAKSISPTTYTKAFGQLIRGIQMLLYSDAVDEFGYDPKFEELVKPIFEFLYYKWFRVSTEGDEYIPHTGRVLLVANHSGTLPLDGAMIKFHLKYVHPARRSVRPLAENFVYYWPFLGTLMNRIGGVRANPENAEILLERDEAVIVFPEGVKGIVKHFSKRYKLQRFGRGGFVRLALRTRSPIIPVAVVGAEEIYPCIAKIDWLGKLINLPTFPITLNMLVLGPLGFIPFPTKWYIKFGPPIDFSEYPPEFEEDDLFINHMSQQIRNTIQEMINELLARRKSIWKG